MVKIERNALIYGRAPVNVRCTVARGLPSHAFREATYLGQIKSNAVFNARNKCPRPRNAYR